MSEEPKRRTAGKRSAPKSKTKPAKVGRPPQEIPADKAAEVIGWVASGKTLRSWCCLPGNPDQSTVFRWKEKDPVFAQNFARAREEGHDAIADETMELVDTIPKDSVEVAWRKNQVWLRLQLLAKWNPKKYGDRVGVDHQGGINVTVVTGVPEE